MTIQADDLSFLGTVPLFVSLSGGERERLAGYLRPADYEDGQVILWEGQAHDRFHIVVRGSVVVSKAVRGEVESVLTHLEAGACFGEFSLIDGRAASATVTAEGTTRVLSIAQEDLLRLLAADSEVFAKLAWAMMRELASKIRATNVRLLETVAWGLDAAALDPER